MALMGKGPLQLTFPPPAASWPLVPTSPDSIFESWRDYQQKMSRIHGHEGTKVSPRYSKGSFQLMMGDQQSYREAWRYTGPFTRYNRFKGAFPGLGIATVAFTAYCAYEYFFLSSGDQHGHTEADHGEGHN